MSHLQSLAGGTENQPAVLIDKQNQLMQDVGIALECSELAIKQVEAPNWLHGRNSVEDKTRKTHIGADC